MLSHRTTAIRELLLVPFASALLAASGPEDRQPIPRDLKIVAEYGAGYRDWTSWQYTITSDGKVAQEIYDLDDTKKMTKISESDLSDLLAKIREANFFKLKNRYEYAVTDNPTLILNVTLDKKTQEVLVYAPEHLKGNKDVKRFFKVWSEILRKIPSPNPEQKPELYKP